MLNCLCVVTHAILTVAPSREDWIRCYGNGFSVIANNENTGLTPCDRVHMSYQEIPVIDVNFAPLWLTCFLIICCFNVVMFYMMLRYQNNFEHLQETK